MDKIEIRKVTPDQLDNLRSISIKTFTETFASLNTAENMSKYLEQSLSSDQLSRELNTVNTEFYFAWLTEDIIGYLKINKGQAQTEIKDDRTLEIERLYVLKEYHGRKVGQILLDKAIQDARAINAPYLWLGVWEDNSRAISFYKKNGFIEFDKHIFRVGDDDQIDIMMKKILNDQ